MTSAEDAAVEELRRAQRERQKLRRRNRPYRAFFAVAACLIVLGTVSGLRSTGWVDPSTAAAAADAESIRAQSLSRAPMTRALTRALGLMSEKTGQSAANKQTVQAAKSPAAPADSQSSPRLFDFPLLGDDDDDDDNCTDPNSQDDPCEFVQDNCDIDGLFNYIEFYYCTLAAHTNKAKAALAYILMIIWLLVLLMSSATTADWWFVPALQYLADFLKLHPAVAGITLLAIGNGANDVFSAMAGLGADDFPLVSGALVGASMCISAFVLGSVIIVSPGGTHGVDRFAFFRDLLAYIICTSCIAAVVADGNISIYESLLFLCLYVGYVTFVVVYTRCIKFDPEAAFSIEKQQKIKKAGFPQAQSTVNAELRSQATYPEGVTEDFEDPDEPLEGEGAETHSNLSFSHVPAARPHRKHRDKGRSDEMQTSTKSPLLTQGQQGVDDDEYDPDDDPDFLPGLHWPRGADAKTVQKIQTVVQYPFSILRYLSIPSSNGQWGKLRRIVAIISLPGFAAILLLDAWGPDSYENTVGPVPLPIIVVLSGLVVSVLVALTSSADVRPRYYVFFPLVAFVSSCLWLDLLAKECVAILQTIGIMWNVSSGLLGLTVLAIGNSIGDFIADTAVARAGTPAIAVATCFGSPMLNDVLGLGISLTIATAESYPDKFHAKLKRTVVIAWVFLVITLVSSLIVFPLFKFNPPRRYGAYLIFLYFAMMVFSCLAEGGII